MQCRTVSLKYLLTTLVVKSKNYAGNLFLTKKYEVVCIEELSYFEFRLKWTKKISQNTYSSKFDIVLN
jgi:hypothetical protein